MNFITKIFGQSANQDTSQTDEQIEQSINTILDANTQLEATSTHVPPENLYQSKIEFILDQNGHVDINVSWSDTSEETAENLGILLYCINSGTLENNCVELLVKIIQEHQNSRSFVKKVIEIWRNKKNKEPLIKPSEVFSIQNQDQ